MHASGWELKITLSNKTLSALTSMRNSWPCQKHDSYQIHHTTGPVTVYEWAHVHLCKRVGLDFRTHARPGTVKTRKLVVHSFSTSEMDTDQPGAKRYQPHESQDFESRSLNPTSRRLSKISWLLDCCYTLVGSSERVSENCRIQSQ